MFTVLETVSKYFSFSFCRWWTVWLSYGCSDPFPSSFSLSKCFTNTLRNFYLACSATLMLMSPLLYFSCTEWELNSLREDAVVIGWLFNTLLMEIELAPPASNEGTRHLTGIKFQSQLAGRSTKFFPSFAEQLGHTLPWSAAQQCFPLALLCSRWFISGRFPCWAHGDRGVFN